MSEIPALAAAWLRDHVTANTPSTGRNEPDKAEGRNVFVVAGAEIDAAVAAAAAGYRAQLASVRVLTTSAVSPTTGMENGDTIDGVVVATGDRVARAVPGGDAANGIYVVVASGAASRATDADTEAELKYAPFAVDQGTHAGEVWAVMTGTITVGVTALDIRRIKAAIGVEAEIIAGRGGKANLDARFDENEADIANLEQGQRDAARLSLFLDPDFTVVRRRDAIHGVRRVIDATLSPNGTWNASYAHEFGVGAWQVATGIGVFGLSTWFDAPEVSDLGIVAGDIVSSGWLVVIPSTKQVHFRIIALDASGAITGSPQLTTVIGTGATQLAQVQNFTLPANAKAVLCYAVEGSPTGTFQVLKHWVVKGARAGDAPPSGRLAEIENAHARLAKPLGFLPNSQWLTIEDDLFATAATVLGTGAPAVYRAVGGGIAGWAAPFIWNGEHIDAIEAWLNVETTGVPLRARFFKNDGAHVVAEARIEAALKNRGLFRFRFDRDCYDLFVAMGVVGGDVCYVNFDVPGGLCQLQGYGPIGFPSAIEDVNFTTYPQKYTTTGAFHDAPITYTNASPTNGYPIAWRGVRFAATGINDEIAPHPDQPVVGPHWCAFGGREANLYLESMRSGARARRFKYSSSIGPVKMEEERLTIIPDAVNGSATDGSVMIDCLDDHGRVAGSSGSIRFDATVPGEGAVNLKVLIPGDSHTAYGRITQRMLDLSAAFPNNVQIELLGTRAADTGAGSSPFPMLTTLDGVANAANKHEGYGGFGLTGSGSSASSFYSTHSSNPFRNGSKKFDIANYLAVNTLASPDVFMPWLFTNDVFYAADDPAAHAAMTNSIGNLDRILGLTADADVVSVIDTLPLCKIVIVMPSAGVADEAAFALNYPSTKQTYRRFKRNNIIARSRLLAHYGGREADNIFLFDAGCVIDSVNGFPFSGANAYPAHTDIRANKNTLKEKTRGINAIHPLTISQYAITGAFSTVNGSSTVTFHHNGHGKRASSGADVTRVRFPTGTPLVGGLAMAGTWKILTAPDANTLTFENAFLANATVAATGSVTAYYIDPGGYEQMGDAAWAFLDCAVQKNWFA